MALKATVMRRRALVRPCRARWIQCQVYLCACVSNGYTDKMKDSGLRIRVQRELRDRFNEACRAEDKSAAQVLREFMRAYVDRHEAAASSSGPREPQGSGGYVTGKAGT